MDDFLSRINNGYDGLIRSIVIDNFNAAEIVLSTMDAQNDLEWINVRFVLTGTEEFKVFQAKNTLNSVLSNGIKYLNDGQTHYIDFSPYSDEIDSVDDVRQSDVYFSCTKITYQVEEYAE